MQFNFPLFLTWMRILAIPIFVAVLYLPEDWISEHNANVTSMWIFILAAVTDWFDGYLARRWNAITTFGRICLLYTSPSPRDRTRSRMPSSA